MEVILITGGARSGKSRYAEAVALARGGDAVTYLATATPGDAEMADRIRRHRARRPAAWRTVEGAERVGERLALASDPVVLLDCLSLLVADALMAGEPMGEAAAVARALGEVDRLLEQAAGREGTLVIVTNEAGMGVVPATPLGRWFRDALGLANQRVAAAAGSVVLTVCGIPLAVKGALPITRAPGADGGGQN